MNKSHRNSLMVRLRETHDLPSLPHILLRFVEMCNREESDIKELASIIEKDPALTFKILGMACSRRSFPSRGVPNLEQALVHLGRDTVVNIALCTSTRGVFSPLHGEPQFYLKHLWKHSLLCALLTREIARRIQYPNKEEAYLTGLLHDIGKLVLWASMPKEYGAVLSRVLDSRSRLPAADRLLEAEAELGFLHSKVGAWLIRKWNLNSLLGDAVLYHHEPVERIIDSFPLVKMVYVVNVLCDESQGKNKSFEIAEKLLGLRQKEVELLKGKAESDLTGTAQFFDIDIKFPFEEDKKLRKKDKEKQGQLNQEIKNISLLSGTLKSLVRAGSEERIIRIFYRALELLFGFKDIIFFTYDFERDILIGKDRLHNLLISFPESKSILAKALTNQSVIHSIETGRPGPISVIDEQVMRSLKREAMVCYPLISGKIKIGVLVIGADKSELSSLARREHEISLLTAQVGSALCAERLRKIQGEEGPLERTPDSSSIARKMVHEVNNPLSIIKNYLTILDQKLKKEKLVMNEIRIIHEEINRVTQLLNELSQFPEQKEQKRESFDMNSLISDLLSISEESLFQPSKITVQTRFDRSLPPIMSHKDNLKQVIINLLKNAAEAMTEGGKLAVSTRYMLDFPLNGSPELPLDHDASQGYVEITVSDNGPGIPETIRSKLFEPFISTKGKDHRGLGLSIVYNIVKALKGRIICRSNREKGTSFVLIFPVGN